MTAQGWKDSGSDHRPLVPHPWDDLAARIYPGAQTVPEAEAALQKQTVDRLVDDVLDHRREARSLSDRIGDENEEGDRARDELVKVIGEEAARDALGSDWDGEWT